MNYSLIIRGRGSFLKNTGVTSGQLGVIFLQEPLKTLNYQANVYKNP